MKSAKRFLCVVPEKIEFKTLAIYLYQNDISA